VLRRALTASVWSLTRRPHSAPSQPSGKRSPSLWSPSTRNVRPSAPASPPPRLLRARAPLRAWEAALLDALYADPISLDAPQTLMRQRRRRSRRRWCPTIAACSSPTRAGASRRSSVARARALAARSRTVKAAACVHALLWARLVRGDVVCRRLVPGAGCCAFVAHLASPSNYSANLDCFDARAARTRNPEGWAVGTRR
jgi:hypothetical protein